MVNNLAASAFAQGGSIRRLLPKWLAGHTTIESSRPERQLFPLPPQRPRPAFWAVEASHTEDLWVAAGEGGFITRVPCYHLPRYSRSEKSGAINWQGTVSEHPPEARCQLAKVVALPPKIQATLGSDLGPTCAFLTASKFDPALRESSKDHAEVTCP